MAHGAREWERVAIHEPARLKRYRLDNISVSGSPNFSEHHIDSRPQLCIGLGRLWSGLSAKPDLDIAHAQWWCCGVRGPRDFLYSAWHNSTQDGDDVISVPASCCPPDDVTVCQYIADRLQFDSAYQAAQHHHNHTVRLQVSLK